MLDMLDAADYAEGLIPEDLMPTELDPLALSVLAELEEAGYPSDVIRPGLDPHAGSILRELEAAGYADDVMPEDPEPPARSVLEELKVLEQARRLTAEECESIGRWHLDTYMRQLGCVPTSSLPGGVRWEYRLRQDDWNITTRVTIGGDGYATIGYSQRIGRADERAGDTGSGTHKLDLGSFSLLSLLGLDCEYWTVYAEDQAAEAFHLMRAMWDYSFAEIPPLLSDLTID
jgi:hypothetical protein